MNPWNIIGWILLVVIVMRLIASLMEVIRDNLNL